MASQYIEPVMSMMVHIFLFYTINAAAGLHNTASIACLQLRTVTSIDAHNCAVPTALWHECRCDAIALWFHRCGADLLCCSLGQCCRNVIVHNSTIAIGRCRHLMRVALPLRCCCICDSVIIFCIATAATLVAH
jgi:hypothetical protein